MKRIEVKLGKTINLGNYESARVDVGLSEDIPDSEKVEKVFKRLLKQTQELLENAQKETKV